VLKKKVVPKIQVQLVKEIKEIMLINENRSDLGVKPIEKS